jgi:hypothetical protein
MTTQDDAQKAIANKMQMQVPVILNNPYVNSAQNTTVASKQRQQSTMGIQSQNREGAVKKAMKHGTKPKYKKSRTSLVQTAVHGGVAFDPTSHCKVCVASRMGLPLPHRCHDKRCIKNRRTRGMSARTVEVEKAATLNKMLNNIKPLKVNWEAKRPTIFDVAQKTGANCKASSSTETQEGAKIPTTAQAHGHLTQEGVNIPPPRIPQEKNPPTKTSLGPPTKLSLAKKLEPP